MKLRKAFSRAAAGALLILALGAGARAEVGTPVPPVPQRWLTDTAGLLSPTVAAELDARLEAYERSSGHQVVVYIAATTGVVPIEDWAVKAFAAWRVGRQGLDDGLALFVMAEDRRVRIEVGYGLEGQVPDAVAGRVINEEMVPRLQSGDYDGAVRAALERLIAVISGDGAADGQGAESPAPAKLTWMQKIIIGIAILGFLLLLITNPSLAIYLLFSILSGGRGGGGGGGFSGGGGRSGGGGASGSW
ncbi:MAG TPA: TPM domain-containing protein [Candidatus Binatia bacterium]|nr:TPM domain-containing protein [Candidatus Binatia bacterium]